MFDKADIVFVPSILETFSASYLEAFASKRPLVVADKDFAHNICGNGALYVNPFDGDATAKAINDVIYDQQKQIDLIKQGSKILEKYGSQSERVNKIIKLLKTVTLRSEP